MGHGHWEIRSGKPLFVREPAPSTHVSEHHRRRWTPEDDAELMQALSQAGPATSKDLGRRIGRDPSTVYDHLAGRDGVTRSHGLWHIDPEADNRQPGPIPPAAPAGLELWPTGPDPDHELLRRAVVALEAIAEAWR